MLFNTLVKYLPLQITEYEYKPTRLPLGKAGPLNDARQQRAASYRKNNTCICFVMSQSRRHFIQYICEIFS